MVGFGGVRRGVGVGWVWVWWWLRVAGWRDVGVEVEGEIPRSGYNTGSLRPALLYAKAAISCICPVQYLKHRHDR
jgi:hypothetical protein